MQTINAKSPKDEILSAAAEMAASDASRISTLQQQVQALALILAGSLAWGLLF